MISILFCWLMVSVGCGTGLLIGSLYEYYILGIRDKMTPSNISGMVFIFLLGFVYPSILVYNTIRDGLVYLLSRFK